MAVTGTFLADFAAFYDAVTQADVKLRSFETGSARVETQLNKMVDSFSGRKVIENATLMAEAVERVGGTSKLTETELARVSSIASEAAAKLRAMGVDVPPGIAKIASETRGASSAHGDLRDTVKDVALGFVAMFSARAAVDFVKDVVNQASALKDLSAQTHINTDELQILSSAMGEFGIDADTLGKGLYRLNRQIAGGDESVVRGLAQMGLSLKDVEGLNGKDLFLKIEDGLATLQGGLRDTTASDLFGSKLGAAMAGAAEGARNAYDANEKLGTYMKGPAIDALDAYGENIERVERNLKSMAANLMARWPRGSMSCTTPSARGRASGRRSSRCCTMPSTRAPGAAPAPRILRGCSTS